MDNELKSRALELRRKGTSLHDIRRQLGIGMAGVQELLRGVAIGVDPSKAHPRIEEMAELRLRKYTACEIAAALKMRRAEVVQALEDAGLRRKRADLLSRQDEIIALYDQGLKVLEIARKLGLLAPSVRTILGRAGRTTARDNEMTPAEILDVLQRADQRWASVANGLRYEDADEQRWSPHRWHSRASVPGITSTAALMVDAR